MAEFVVDFRVEHLSQLLAEEANSFGGVEDQVKSLHRELRLINIFLKNSERKRSAHRIMGDDQFQSKQSKEDKINNMLKRRGHQMVENVIRKIVDVAYEAEEVIDTIIFDVAIQIDKPKKIDNASHVRLLHDVAKKIEDLNKETNTIYGNIERYGIERAEASVDAASEARYKRWREVEEDDVVGF